MKKIIKEIKETIVPDNPEDSKSKKLTKKVVWIMFVTLMTCGIIAMLIAVSFAH